MDGLRRREGGGQPDLVPGLEVGNLGDGQSPAGSGDVDGNFWAGEVETRGGGVQGGAQDQEGWQDSGKTGGAQGCCAHVAGGVLEIPPIAKYAMDGAPVGF